jgi:uncharacterized protein DUF3592
MTEPPFSYLIQAALLLNAALFSAGAVYVWWFQWRKLRTYLPVPANVVSTGVAGSVESTTVSTGTPGQSSATACYYTPVVTYRYAVNGKEYTSSQVRPGSESATWSSYASRITEQYAPGQEVEAYYNPTDPSDAFLRREYGTLTYIVPAAAVIGWILTLGFLYFAFWR